VSGSLHLHQRQVSEIKLHNIREELAEEPRFTTMNEPPISDAHESSILDEVLDLASFFFASKSPRSTRAVLENTRLLPVSFSSLALFLKRLDTPRGYSRVCHPPR
jgi:hypothetical protein